MASAAQYALILDKLDNEARDATELGPGLFSRTVTMACTRLALLNKLGRAARVDRFADAGAWCEAVMALIELELPAWKLCRAVCEDGEWTCSLSRQPNLPLPFGDVVEGIHESLSLALLRAFLNARRWSISDGEPARAAPQEGIAPWPVLCSDNFR